MKSFADNGYVIIKNAIRKKIINNLQDTILDKCKNTQKIKLSKQKYEVFSNYSLNNRSSEFDFCKSIYESFLYKNIIDEILLEKKYIVF